MIEAYSYDLPRERIAQRPLGRGDAKLLVCDRRAGLSDRLVAEIPDLLRSGDLLVLNDTRVLARRFFVEISGKECELFIVRLTSEGEAEALARPLDRFREGLTFEVAGGAKIRVLGRSGSMLRLKVASPVISGMMPIPPYIRNGRADVQDTADYQTVFARSEGSIAAPTAGLHFTQELLSRISKCGVQLSFITLHVGLHSILPMEREERQDGGALGAECYAVGDAVLREIERTKSGGGRVVAVGTTVVRALESAVRAGVRNGETAETTLVITPGFEFRAVDAMMTNFHQPGSSHLALVEAFLGRDLLDRVYRHALTSGYRFLSYGDTSLLL